MRHNDIFQKGGDKPFDANPKTLNRFTDPQMEKHLNPIYGLVLCESGYLQNLYFLKKSGLIESFSENYSKLYDEEMQKKVKDDILEYTTIIHKSCTHIRGLNILKPTNDMMNMDPQESLLDLGRYIAVKYLNKIILPKEKKFVVKTANAYKINPMYVNKNTEEKEKIIKCVARFNKFINIDKDDVFAFHILLFCLWWKVDTNEGFEHYYKGIEEVFDFFNANSPDVKIPHLANASASATSASASTNKSFEELAMDITRIDFKLYEQHISKNFCEGAHNSVYPDCGETVARNIINILCLNGNKFDTKILEKKGAIQEVIEYYTVFNTFNSQSTTEPTEIFNMKLNARDAWSKLVIDKSQDNINFRENCHGKYGYDMDGGLTKIENTNPTKQKSNLLQMFNNLFKGIEEWTDLASGGNITDINARNINMKYGTGYMTITNNSKLTFTVRLYPSHYSIELPKKKDEIKYDHLSQPQKDILDVLLKKNITEKNYIEINFSSDKIVDVFLNDKNPNVKFGLFELSLTDKYDNDARRRMIIDTEGALFEKISKFGNNEKINNYTFKLFNDFEFVKKLPVLKVLNTTLSDQFNNYVKKIDLTPLLNIEEIGDGFLSGFMGDIIFPEINLTSLENDDIPLKNVHTIGNYFLSENTGITKVDLSFLQKLTKIGNSFLQYSNSVEMVDFSKLTKLTEIGTNFLYHCRKIEEVDLSSSPLISIGNSFLNECTSLHTVKFNPNPTITNIGKFFMPYCYNLKSVDFRCLENVETIKGYFLEGCENIENVDLSSLIKLSTIEESFLTNCQSLNEIKFNNDANITRVGEMFLFNCYSLQTIDIKCLKNINTIDNLFMSGCTKIVDVQFPDTFPNLTEIKSSFMTDTRTLENINLSCFSKVTQIGKSFLLRSGIRQIDFSPLTELTSVGRRCMDNCHELETVVVPLRKRRLIFNGDNLDDCPRLNKTISCTGASCTIMGGSKRPRRSTRKIKKNYRRTTRRHK